MQNKYKSTTTTTQAFEIVRVLVSELYVQKSHRNSILFKFIFSEIGYSSHTYFPPISGLLCITCVISAQTGLMLAHTAEFILEANKANLLIIGSDIVIEIYAIT